MATAVPSIQHELLAAVLAAVEANKPALLAALASQNVSIESFIAAALKASVKNPLLAAVLGELTPVIAKSLPNIEASAFASLDALVKAELAHIA